MNIKQRLILILTLAATASQAAVVGVYGGSHDQTNAIADFISASGHTVFSGNDNPQTLTGFDVLINFSPVTTPYPHVAEFVRHGGLLITEYSGAYRPQQAGLINIDTHKVYAAGHNTPITFTDNALLAGLENQIGTTYYSQTPSPWAQSLTHIGSDVTLLALLPDNTPVMVGSRAGEGYVLLNLLNWKTGFDNGNHATGQWLLNAIDNKARLINTANTVPEPAPLILLGTGLIALLLRRQAKTTR